MQEPCYHQHPLSHRCCHGLVVRGGGHLSAVAHSKQVDGVGCLDWVAVHGDGDALSVPRGGGKDELSLRRVDGKTAGLCVLDKEGSPCREDLNGLSDGVGHAADRCVVRIDNDNVHVLNAQELGHVPNVDNE
jgi:hypothetical protein